VKLHGRMSTQSMIAAAVLIGLACAAGGCRAPEEETEAQRFERARQYTIGYIEEEDEAAGALLPAYAKKARLEALRMLRAKAVPRCPFAMSAVLDKDSGGSWTMLIEWLELDKDTEGLLIIERDLQSGREHIEKYPLSPTIKEDRKDPEFWLFRQMPGIPVRIRETDSPSETKSVEVWHRWEQVPSTETWPPAPIWVRLPSERFESRLAIYDEMGHVSDAIPIHVWAAEDESASGASEKAPDPS